MTREEAIKMVKAKLECMTRDVSGRDSDCIDRRCDECPLNYEQGNMGEQKEWLRMAIKALEQTRWIPVSEKLPEGLESVNITWINHNPESYYADIKDEPHTATGIYYKGRWYWYSSTCEDYLKEYGRCDVDEIDADIEVTAWMPLPPSYKAESEE